MNPCTQEDRIGRIEGAVGEINKSVGALSSDVAVIKDKVLGMSDQVTDHERVLRGSNGDLGVISKIENSLPKIDRMEQAIFEDGGLKESMKDISACMAASREREVAAAEKEKAVVAEKKDNFKWLWRYVLGAIIGALITYFAVLLNMR